MALRTFPCDPETDGGVQINIIKAKAADGAAASRLALR